MIKFLIDKVSDEFKETLLSDTRKEVQKLIHNYTLLTEEEKNNIDVFFVQPLFWSRLYFYAGIYKMYNELSLQEIIASDDLSESEKQSILAELLLKTNTASTGSLETDARQLINKLFFNNKQFSGDISHLLSVNKSIKNITIGKEFNAFNNINKYLFSEFHTLFLSENMSTVYPILELDTKTMDFKNISDYKNISLVNTYPNVANVYFSIDTLRTEKRVVVASSKEEVVYLPPYLFDLQLNFIKGDADSCRIEYVDNGSMFGFSDRRTKIIITPRAKIEISYKYLKIEDSNLVDIYKSLNGLSVNTFLPFKIDIELDVGKQSSVKLFDSLTQEYINYSDFFSELRNIRDNIEKNGDITFNHIAKSFINPFVFKKIPFNYSGVSFGESKVWSNIDKNNIVVKITKINIKDS